MTYSWQNEDGEPIMDGAAWRFEQQLDIDSRDDYYADQHYYDDDREVDPADCTHGDRSWDTDYDTDTVTAVECDICGTEAVSWDTDEDVCPANIVWTEVR